MKKEYFIFRSRSIEAKTLYFDTFTLLFSCETRLLIVSEAESPVGLVRDGHAFVGVGYNVHRERSTEGCKIIYHQINILYVFRRLKKATPDLRRYYSGRRLMGPPWNRPSLVLISGWSYYPAGLFSQKIQMFFKQWSH